MPSSSLIFSARVSSWEYSSSSTPSFSILLTKDSGIRNPDEKPSPELPFVSTMNAIWRLMCSCGVMVSIPASTPTPKSAFASERANLALFEAPSSTSTRPMGCALTTEEASTSTNLEPRRKEEKTFFTPSVFAGLREPIATSGWPAEALRGLGTHVGCELCFIALKSFPRLLQTRLGTLKAVEPFDFQRSMNFLGGFGPMADEQFIGDGAITKAMMVDGRVVVFRVRDAGTGGSTLSYELFSQDELDDRLTKAVEDRISFFLSLDDDVQEFYSIAKADTAYYP